MCIAGPLTFVLAWAKCGCSPAPFWHYIPDQYCENSSSISALSFPPTDFLESVWDTRNEQHSVLEMEQRLESCSLFSTSSAVLCLLPRPETLQLRIAPYLSALEKSLTELCLFPLKPRVSVPVCTDRKNEPVAAKSTFV